MFLDCKWSLKNDLIIGKERERWREISFVVVIHMSIILPEMEDEYQYLFVIHKIYGDWICSLISRV